MSGTVDREALDDLERSGLTDGDAASAGMFCVDNARRLYNNFKRRKALVIPYYTIDGSPVTFGPDKDEFCRVRYLGDLDPEPFTGRKPQRYDQPGGSGCYAYFPRVTDLDWSSVAPDAAGPLVITEGEKKALKACLSGIVTLGLGGVANIVRDERFLPELDTFELSGRDVFIAFDSDSRINVEIQRAEARLVEELRKRGARVFVVRIPFDGDKKVGLDDYIVAYGAKRFSVLMEQAMPLDDMDAAVIAMNRNVCWISKEGQIFDLNTREFMSKDNFLRGEIYGSEKAASTVTAGRKPGTRLLPVAPKWLQHPYALRYADRIFRPGEGPLLETESGQALNIWEGYKTTPGDVQPFLDLTAFLFRNLPEEHRDLALRLIIYKAQNPAEKIPLAVLLISPHEGGGKSLWGSIVQEAFGDYGVRLGSRDALTSDFSGWLEHSLFALVDEVEVDDMRRGYERLKGMISDLRRHMNEKYRLARQINSYTFYLLTTNRLEVAALSRHDRRMFVVDCPGGSELGGDAAQKAFFDPIYDWKNNRDGGKKLMHWMLSVDLEGWRPPQRAPETSDKVMAAEESLSDVARLANEMLTADEHVVKRWISTALMWADNAAGSNIPSERNNARATLEVLPQIQIRPFYTADELALLFPSLTASLSLNRRTVAAPAGLISRQLRENGIPYLRCTDSPKGFMHKGVLRQYLVVSDQEDWRTPITQAHFDTLMKSYPRYKQIARGPRKLAKESAA